MSPRANCLLHLVRCLYGIIKNNYIQCVFFIDKYIWFKQRFNIYSFDFGMLEISFWAKSWTMETRSFLISVWSWSQFLDYCLHTLFEDWPQVLNEICFMVMNTKLFTETLGYYFCIMTFFLSCWKKTLFISALLLDLWQKFLLEDIVVLFRIHGSVLMQKCEQKHSLGRETALT